MKRKFAFRDEMKPNVWPLEAFRSSQKVYVVEVAWEENQICDSLNLKSTLDFFLQLSSSDKQNEWISNYGDLIDT